MAIFILPVLGFPIHLHFWQQFDAVHVHLVSDLFFWFCKFVFVYFLNMWFSGIIAITNSNVDSASPWNTPHWIFPAANLLHLAVNSSLHFFTDLMTLSASLKILRVYYPALWVHFLYLFAVSIYAIATFFRLILLFWRMNWSMYRVHLLFFLFACGILPVLWRTVRGLYASRKYRS